MKKILAGILVVAVVFTVVGGVQYTSKPDTFGLDSNLSQTVNV
ncbi:Phr family secreted Rap phosphatase inhibitor [Bacillus cereus]|uniref:NprX family peptide pheromone n=1 Tax=Bacillus arachidis TaxID=2819290 RepID=A0ABS3P232_9BACI|nr:MULTISPECIES: NprX family peptide pheromone [Bacillus]PEY42099.1 Phr family secreted Rap phosphatase inhibitor [Bacillus cereus]MBO1626880.1 NprX family peptide pheromone [Bacillus arachidis]PFE04457.1 Phr family secreted Rap phosphatase inhibitor [Bacillus sp. AFS023182]PGY02746.1 Phr family secreted Rap phosphatase inhibitor [Bacillus cereus]WIY61869.1 NprX family peptide pheromone [Bacillus arachidis]